MIHLARPTVSPVVNIVFTWQLFGYARFWAVRTYVRTDNLCENNDHYRPWLWVGRVVQKRVWKINGVITQVAINLETTRYNSQCIEKGRREENFVYNILFDSSNFSSMGDPVIVLIRHISTFLKEKQKKVSDAKCPPVDALCNSFFFALIQPTTPFSSVIESSLCPL